MSKRSEALRPEQRRPDRWLRLEDKVCLCCGKLFNRKKENGRIVEYASSYKSRMCCSRECRLKMMAKSKRKTWITEYIESNKEKACACGCGKALRITRANARCKRRYLQGHNVKKNPIPHWFAIKTKRNELKRCRQEGCKKFVAPKSKHGYCRLHYEGTKEGRRDRRILATIRSFLGVGKRKVSSEIYEGFRQFKEIEEVMRDEIRCRSDK